MEHGMGGGGRCENAWGGGWRAKDRSYAGVTGRGSGKGDRNYDESLLARCARRGGCNRDVRGSVVFRTDAPNHEKTALVGVLLIPLEIFSFCLLCIGVVGWFYPHRSSVFFFITLFVFWRFRMINDICAPFENVCVIFINFER